MHSRIFSVRRPSSDMHSASDSVRCQVILTSDKLLASDVWKERSPAGRRLNGNERVANVYRSVYNISLVLTEYLHLKSMLRLCRHTCEAYDWRPIKVVISDLVKSAQQKQRLASGLCLDCVKHHRSSRRSIESAGEGYRIKHTL